MKMTKPLGHKIRDLFFYEDATAAGTGDAADGARVYRCRCGETRTLRPGERSFAGFTAHVVSEHEEWLAAAVRDSGDATASDGSAVEQSNEENGASAAAEAPREAATRKRSDYLPWDDYFMSVAFLSAMRSKGGHKWRLYALGGLLSLTLHAGRAPVVNRSVDPSWRVVSALVSGAASPGD